MRRAETSALERELRPEFHRVVLAKRPVVGWDPVEAGPVIVEAHHVIPKRVFNSHRLTFRMDEEEKLRLRWDPDNGLPVEQGYHEQLTNGSRKLDPRDLRPENVEFASRIGLKSILEREVPGAWEVHGP